ncbi:MAG: adenylate/guanylate cyclase domain-containing protein [Alphaproteobacteria bacterium]|nr:adenylate/guanylate cyclase domain-containing protein [Alphaproteobacteria bacterium]
MDREVIKDIAESGGWRRRLLNRLRHAFQEEERQGLLLAIKVRSISMVVILIWYISDEPSATLAVFFGVSFILMFLILGLFQHFLLTTRNHPAWVPYIFILADCLLLSTQLVTPNPFETETVFSNALSLRGSSFVWYFLFLMQATFSLRPRLVLWCGFSIIATRFGSMMWVLSSPEIFYQIDIPTPTPENLMKLYFDQNFVSIEDRIQEFIAVSLVAIGLAVVTSRTLRFVENRAEAERSRSNLARYFSPNMVDEISLAGGLDRTPREQDIAILFTDIIGFTTYCETEPAENIVTLLREYHNLLSGSVFRYNGTLDKYMGDGLMATFGTPRTGPHDATDALRCALELVENLHEWTQQRARQSEAPLSVGIGLHYGAAVMGDIGNERHVEFAVIGDSVNVASRIEHLTRELDAPLTVSQDLINAIKREDAGGGALIRRLVDTGPQNIRGRKKKIGVWVAPRPATTPE